MNFTPTIHYHAKDDKKGNPLAIKDFLSKKHQDQHFSEKYVIEIIKQSNFFKNRDLCLVEEQSNKEPDVIDKKTNIKYEIKTFWNQSGCEMLSLDKDFAKTFKALNFNEDLDFQFKNWNKPDNYNNTTKNIIKKMKNKQMNYILFMINCFCLDSPSMFSFYGSIDIDALKWQYVLKANNFNFTIYIIKPTFFNQFAIHEITKESIKKEVVSYNDFFKKYITTENISI